MTPKMVIVFAAVMLGLDSADACAVAQVAPAHRTASTEVVWVDPESIHGTHGEKMATATTTSNSAQGNRTHEHVQRLAVVQEARLHSGPQTADVRDQQHITATGASVGFDLQVKRGLCLTSVRILRLHDVSPRYLCWCARSQWLRCIDRAPRHVAFCADLRSYNNTASYYLRVDLLHLDVVTGVTNKDTFVFLL